MLGRSSLELVALLMLTLCGCADTREPPTDPPNQPERTGFLAPELNPLAGVGADQIEDPLVADLNTQIAFEDASHETGLDFVFQTGATGRALMPEATGGGCAWIDFDRDGISDLYFVQGGDLLAGAVNDLALSDQLYRGQVNHGHFSFANVTGPSDIHDSGYGHGVAVGDMDNDGFDDIYVTNIRENVMLQNQGDGTFKDITAVSGTGDPRWSTSCAWADLDADGDLDLYVCNYLDYDARDPFPCYSKSGKPAICDPSSLKAVENACFENLGDGRFKDQLSGWGLVANDSKSLGVVVADLNVDGRQDIYVANDVMPNLLFLGTESLRFEDKAVAFGCAMNAGGMNQASMGIGCEDFDNNGFPDLYVTHFSADSNTLYANLGSGFRDVTKRQGLHKPTLSFLGFGCSMADFDCNGLMDLFVANGHVNYGAEGKMVPQLFAFDGDRWHQPKNQSQCFLEPKLGRAVVQGDFNDDGTVDLVVVNQLERASLLINESQCSNWLNIELIGTTCNRRGLGARVIVQCGDKVLTRQMISGGSYCASHQPRLFFGLADWDQTCHITVHWPYSTIPSVLQATPNQLITIRQ